MLFQSALIRACLVTSIVSIASASLAVAEPREQTEVSLSRTAESAQTLTTTLTKNVYRYVDRDETYYVQVPYTVSVPYQAEETYYTSEQECHWVPRQECTYQQRCHTVPIERRECHQERVCDTHGCHLQQVCVLVPDTKTVCENYPVCHTENRYECDWVQVPHTRIVTRYRDETRYRTEERHRIVTDKIFERQWSVNVAIEMPADSPLYNDESETVLVSLGGTEAEPSANVSIDSKIYNYKVLSQSLNERTITITIQPVAKYAPEDLAEQTITSIAMVPTDNGASEIRFEDSGVVARTTTEYSVDIADKDTGKWIFSATQAGQFGTKQVRIPVTVAVETSHDHLIRLSVSRRGAVISGNVDFDKEQFQVGQLDPAPYINPNGVRDFAIEGRNGEAHLVFTDDTVNDSKVDTRYEISIKRRVLGFLWQTTITKAIVARPPVPGTSINFPLATFPGVDAKELKRFFDAGDTIYLEVAITRISPRLTGVSPVHINKEAKLKIR